MTIEQQAKNYYDSNFSEDIEPIIQKRICLIKLDIVIYSFTQYSGENCQMLHGEADRLKQIRSIIETYEN